MRNATVLLLLAATATNDIRCGPTPQEIGQAVVVITPVVFALGAGLVWGLLWLWRFPEGAPRLKPLLLLGAALCVPAVVHFFASLEGGLLVAALWLYGTSYATVLLLSLRIALWLAPRRAWLLAHLPPLILFGLPAFVLATGRAATRWLGCNAEDYFTLPGMGGWVPGGLLLVLLIEAFVRRRRARATSSVPAPAP